jgi:hypothetical protein
LFNKLSPLQVPGLGKQGSTLISIRCVYWPIGQKCPDGKSGREKGKALDIT